jgi:hypothetical protein
LSTKAFSGEASTSATADATSCNFKFDAVAFRL